MASTFSGLRPQKQAEQHKIAAYDTDISQFKAALVFLNKDLGPNQGCYTEQDLFAQLVTQLQQIQGFEEFFASTLVPRKGRRKKNDA